MNFATHWMALLTLDDHWMDFRQKNSHGAIDFGRFFWRFDRILFILSSKILAIQRMKPGLIFMFDAFLRLNAIFNTFLIDGTEKFRHFLLFSGKIYGFLRCSFNFFSKFTFQQKLRWFFEECFSHFFLFWIFSDGRKMITDCICSNLTKSCPVLFNSVIYFQKIR